MVLILFDTKIIILYVKFHLAKIFCEAKIIICDHFCRILFLRHNVAGVLIIRNKVDYGFLLKIIKRAFYSFLLIVLSKT